MSDTKQFRTLVLASLTCERMLCHGTYSDIHEAVSHLMGFPVWTHEMLTYADAAKAEALAQFPDLPATPPDDWQACADAAVARYGETVGVIAGQHIRTSVPMETLRDLNPNAEVIVLDIGGAA